MSDEIKHVMRNVPAVVQKEFFVCPLCKQDKTTEQAAKDCAAADRKRIKEEKERQRLWEREYNAKVERALERIPKLSEEEYALLACHVALEHCPPIVPCLMCGHPHVQGYQCTNPDCAGDDEVAMDIDQEDLFYDEQFELPDCARIVFKEG